MNAYDRLALPPMARVLDVGCARGDNAALLSGRGHRVLAVEIEADLVEVARRRLPADVMVVRADVAALPVATGSFDAAVLLEVFEHLPDPPRGMTEIRRAIRHGGTVTVALPTSYTEKLYRRLHPRYVENSTHFRSYPRSEVQQILRAAGFRVDAVAPENFDAALKWVLYALFRVDSDHTGRLLGGRWIEKGVNGLLKITRRIPVVSMGLRWLEARLGKSWYFHCVAV